MLDLFSTRNRRVTLRGLNSAGILLLFLLALCSAPGQSAQSSKQGEATNKNPIPGPIGDDCVVFGAAPDLIATGCLIWGSDAIPLARQIEIHSKGGRTVLLTPGGSIKESHFWHNGRETAISFINAKNRRADALYETETGLLIDKVDEEPPDRSKLPEWAKDQSERDDEAVPESQALNAERAKWIEKVLHQVETIRPGMHRKDLDTYFTMDGGLATRTQERYVYRNCPVIKVDIRFKAPDDAHKNRWNDPEDIIESVSGPYLEPMFMD